MASAFSSRAFAIVKDLIYLLARDFNCFIVLGGCISPWRKHKKNIIIKYILKILKYCVTQLHKSLPFPPIHVQLIRSHLDAETGDLERKRRVLSAFMTLFLSASRRLFLCMFSVVSSFMITHIHIHIHRFCTLWENLSCFVFICRCLSWRRCQSC